MIYDPELHRRRSIRLVDYDYRQPGYYFFTVCTQDRRCLLGNLKRHEISLSSIGRIVAECWDMLPAWFPHVRSDAFVIMPNHVHGILQFADLASSTLNLTALDNEQTRSSLACILRTFKSATTRLARQRSKHSPQVIWQRNYFEHIIKTDRALLHMRQYILDNPIKWHLDELNPSRLSSTSSR